MRRLILCLILILLPVPGVLAQCVALVVGVSAYRTVAALTNTLNDAQDLAAPSRRTRESDLARYVAGRDHKAMVIHGSGRLYWRTGAASAAEAQDAALRACTEAIERANREGACLLYAICNRVVLSERRRSIAL